MKFSPPSIRKINVVRFFTLTMFLLFYSFTANHLNSDTLENTRLNVDCNDENPENDLSWIVDDCNETDENKFLITNDCECLEISVEASYDGEYIIESCTEITWTISAINTCSETIEAYIYLGFNEDHLYDSDDIGVFTYQDEFTYNSEPYLRYLIEAQQSFEEDEEKNWQFETTLEYLQSPVNRKLIAGCADNDDGLNVAYPAEDIIQADDQFQFIQGPVKISELLLEDPSPVHPYCRACDTNPQGCLEGPSFQKLYIEGELEIDIDYCFKGDNAQNPSVIAMGEGASIRVNSSRLDLSHVEFFGCQTMWRGIIVENANSRIVSHHNVKISDAQYGIELRPIAISQLSNITFTDNYVGIYTAESSSPQDIDISVGGCKFIGTGSMKPPYQGQSPTPSNDLPLAGVLAHSGGGKINYGEFRNLQYGIGMLNTSFYVVYSTFTDITETGIFAFGSSLVQKGLGILENDLVTFDNCKDGIVSMRTFSALARNKMENMNTGINVYFSQNQYVQILSNEIKASQVGIRANLNFPLNGEMYHNHISVGHPTNPNNAYGIFINEIPYGPTTNVGVNDLGWRIDNNYILQERATHGILYRGGILGTIINNTIDSYDSQWETNRGLSLENCVGMNISCNFLESNGMDKLGTGIRFASLHESVVRCNQVTNTRFGINPHGMNYGYLFGNEMEECFYGLMLGAFGDESTSTYIGTHPHFGNLWTGSYPSGPGAFGAYHNSDAPEIVLLSRFYVDSETNSDLLPTWYTPASVQWFTDEDDNDGTYECETEPTCPNGVGWYDPYNPFAEPDPDEKLTKAIAKDSVYSEFYSDAMNWTGARSLYRRLAANTQVVSADTLMENFFNHHATTTVGAFYNIDRAILQVYHPDSTANLELYQVADSIKSLMYEMIYIDSLLLTGLSEMDSLELLEDLDSLSDIIYLLDVERHEQVEEITTDRATAFNTIRQNNAAISVSEIYEINQKRVNDIYLSTIALDRFEFDSIQTDALEGIAWQCPWSGGDAVFQARSMLSIVRDTVYNDSLLCAQQQYRLAGKPKPESKLMIYPNPANDNVTIEFEKESSGNLRIFNAIGQVKHVVAITENKAINLNTAKWVPGVYFVVFNSQDNRKITGSIIITR